MDKRQALQLIQQLFTQPFELDKYRHFVRNLLNHYEERSGHYTGNYIPDAFKQHVNQYWRIGKYVDPDGNQLDLLVVEVKSLAKLERARSSLRNFAVNRLKQFEKEASLIAFYAQDDDGADWRFSFVKIEHEAYQDEKGKVKLKQELTPARRYSYLVGQHENSHTACKQLLPILEMDYADPKVEEIEAAFSIEKVTDEFFDQYKALFQKLAEHLKKQPWFKQASDKETDQAVSRFAKKLLGQIVFLYFLQKKGWLGAAKGKAWGEGSKRFLRERYDQVAKSGNNYYRDFLQYLFYEALACKREEQDDPGYYERFQCRVPFLNGGLFEADYDWQQVNIEIPNSLFHNDEKTKEGDVGTGILDVFDRYNFTIKEDEPLDKEVAVDPEMLGKVFENMLEITERKSKGAFYTPREIVHYMCQESLIHYLDNRLNSYATSYEELDSPQTGLFANTTSKGQLKLTAEHQDIKVPKEDIETLIRKGHLALENDTRVLSKGKETRDYKFQLPESVRNHAKAIDEALADIKVCDPAIGSGAFPVGLLHEIVNARQALAPHSGNTQSAYELKRHAIAESIYGVDIDASAIDIARLRLWLSLIVDEEDYGTIAALPNLDYKIVRGNSLIGFPENWSSPAFDKIEELKKQFFAETDHDKKAKLKVQIDNEIQQWLADSKRVFGHQVDFDFRLMFSEVWHYKGGFDVVIGNPPYGAKLSDDHKHTLKQRYSNISDRIRNSFLYFIGLSESIVSKRGVSILIVPNEFLYQVYMGKARRHYLSNKRLFLAINIGESAFKAVVPTCIIGFDGRKSSNYFVSGYDFRSLSLKQIEWQLKSTLPNKISSRLLLERPGQIFSFDIDAMNIVREIVGGREKLEDFCCDIANGISTSCDAVYVIDEILAIDRKMEPQYLKPTLKGRDIQKFNCPKSTGKLVLYIDKEFDKSIAPNIYCYLLENKELLISKSVEKKKGIRDWHVLFRCRYPELFSSPKILVRQTGDSIVAALDERVGYYCIDSLNVISLKPEYRLNKIPQYFVGLLNSDVINFFYQQISQEAGRVMAQVKPRRLKELPVSIGIGKIEVASMVDYLTALSTNKFELQKSFFLDILNAIVFELYFPNEMKAAGKNALSHLGELTQITDEMSDEEKLAIIQREFDRLYDPGHPVRNIIETLDSVEVVRTIREALQRK